MKQKALDAKFLKTGLDDRCIRSQNWYEKETRNKTKRILYLSQKIMIVPWTLISSILIYISDLQGHILSSLSNHAPLLLYRFSFSFPLLYLSPLLTRTPSKMTTGNSIREFVTHAIFLSEISSHILCPFILRSEIKFESAWQCKTQLKIWKWKSNYQSKYSAPLQI